MYIDIFLLILLGWAVVNGWLNGFIKEALNSLGIIAGLALAGVLYATLGQHLTIDGFSELQTVLNVIAFMLACVVVPLALGFVANLLTIAVNNPLTGLPNHLLGAVFSVAKFLLLISFTFNIMAGLNIMSESNIKNSTFYDPITKVLPFVRNEIVALKEERGKAWQTPGDEARPDTTYIYFDRGRTEPRR